MKKELIKIITNEANNSILELETKGYISGGNNGPYDDNETPYRVCSHWIYIYDYLYKYTNNIKYLNAIKKIADYLYSEYLKNDYIVYKCRDKKGKDYINGTIGNAWIIEGLIKLAYVLNEKKYYDAATAIFLQFKYNKKIGMWDRVECDGKILGYDGTFNHQLWLAAAGCQIINYEDNIDIRETITSFLDKCASRTGLIFNTHSDGLIKHFSCVKDSIKHIIKYYLDSAKNYIADIRQKSSMRYKEEGYHFFAMYGFALIYRVMPNHKLFKTKKFKKSLEYTFNKKNYQKLINQSKEKDQTKLAMKFKNNSNIYAFPYNSPFFELPYIYITFNKNEMKEEEFNELWNIQKEMTISNGKFCNNTNDIVTLNARLYELIRYLELIDSNDKKGRLHEKE